jgi:hypothetical protein
MSEVQQQDRDKAESIMATCQSEYGQEVWITDGHAAGMDLRDAIALALAQARDAGYKAAYAELTKSDTPIDVSPLRWVGGKRCAPENHILDDQGRVLKVDGILPIAANAVKEAGR